ncbi:hypothetical protein TMatcc_011269 [Talaromyces marneffei ATCC 18224]
MEQLAETADLLLQHINSNPDDQLNEIFLRAFVQQGSAVTRRRGGQVAACSHCGLYISHTNQTV